MSNPDSMLTAGQLAVMAVVVVLALAAWLGAVFLAARAVRTAAVSAASVSSSRAQTGGVEGSGVSAGKMSALWSGHPVSVKLADLDVICAVLDCEIGELLIPEPDKVPLPDADADAEPEAANGRTGPRIVPRRRDGRSVPPV